MGLLQKLLTRLKNHKMDDVIVPEPSQRQPARKIEEVKLNKASFLDELRFHLHRVWWRRQNRRKKT